MDSYEATRIVFSRVTKLDPENASKIMGLLLIQDHGEKEMIRLAFGPENFLHSVILKARKDLGLMPTTCNSSQSSNSAARQQLSLSIPNPSWSNDETAMMMSSSSTSPGFFGHGGPDHVLEELQMQGHHHSNLSFLNDAAPMDMLPSTSPTNGSDQPMFSSSYGLHRRSCSVSDAAACLDDPNSGFGWKPCLYYARGYCKNGGGCRFLHGGEDGVGGPPLVGSPSKAEMMEHHHELMRSKSVQQQRLAAALNSFPYSSKCMSFLLHQQQQTDAQRAAAALMMGEDMHKFSRSPRIERSEFAMMYGGGAGMVNPASRQIYLTFPADSTFREEDVSNYFSIYGPVQDVRIPYQQKRMFGFVTFVYPETVKLILAKGNPHFVCDARVLVKPYKEKGKVHDKKQQGERGDLSPCGTPTGLDGRDPYDLQLGARMFYNSQDMLRRRKLEEQAELQQALELQSQRLMGLQLLDVKKHHHRALSASSPISSPSQSPSMFSHSFLHPSFHGQEENCASPVMPPSAVSADQQHKELAALATGKDSASNSEESGSSKHSPHEDDDICGLLGNMEHILPNSPFASPTKGARDYLSAFPALANETNDSSDASNANTTLATSPEMTSFKPFNCQLPRLSSGHGAIGMYAPGAAGPKCPVGTS